MYERKKDEPEILWKKPTSSKGKKSGNGQDLGGEEYAWRIKESCRGGGENLGREGEREREAEKKKGFESVSENSVWL